MSGIRLLQALCVVTVAMTCLAPELTKAQGIRYYGNWGGPGYGGGRPIDDLDRAYRRHDHRYTASGHWGLASKADGQLIEESLVASLNPLSNTRLHGRVLGPASAAIFAAKPSLYRTRILGKRVHIPSVGATSFGLLQVERGVKGGRKMVNGIGKRAGKILNKIF